MRDYLKKTFGRFYSSGSSLEKISKQVRKKCFERIVGGVYELGTQNYFLSFLESASRKCVRSDVEEGDVSVMQTEFPLLCHVNANMNSWARFVAEYFDIEQASAKRLFLSALSPLGKQTPDAEARPDWLPHLDGLQQEIVKAASCLAAHDALYKEVSEKRSDASVLHIFLGELECRAMLAMKEVLEKVGAVPISLVYDGIYFRPMGLDFESPEFQTLISEVEYAHGIVINIKALSGEKLAWRQPVNSQPHDSVAMPSESHGCGLPSLFAFCEATTCRIEPVVGTDMCVPVALLNLKLVAGEPSQSAMANGPYTYRSLQNYYHLDFTLAPFEELLCADSCDKFLFHFGKCGTCGHAIGLIPEVGAKSFLIYDSNLEFVHRISDELLYDLVLQSESTSRQCWLIRVSEGDPQILQDNDEFLDISAGAKTALPPSKRGKL